MTRDAELANLQEVIDGNREELSWRASGRTLTFATEKSASLEQALEKSIRDVAARTKKIDQLRNSTSWRLTAPLRLLSRTAVKVTRAILRPFTAAR